MSSLSAIEYTLELGEFESRHNMGDKTKALYEQVNKCLPQLILGIKYNAKAAIFVPI